MKSLNELKIGEVGIIKSINDKSLLKLRLLDIGFINGSFIECMYNSSFNGLRAYKIKNMIVALRNRDALNILLED